MPASCSIAIRDPIASTCSTLTIAADDTVGLLPCLPPARWYHELELTDGAGNVSIIIFDLRPFDHGAGGFDDRAKTIMIPMRDFEMFDT
jgi:hypothetical protein